MYVDSVTTAALVEEFRQRLLGGRVQNVVEVSEEAVGFEIYSNRQRQYLLLNAEHNDPRALIVPDKLRRGTTTPSPLGLLLKKYIDGGILQDVHMPPWERVLTLDFSNAQGETSLVVEMVNRRANVIMVVEDEILDSLRRVGPAENSRRLILPRHKYVPPPPQEKALPEAVTPSLLATWLEEEEGKIPAWKVLVGHVAGVSPLFAREIVYRATEDAKTRSFDVAAPLLYETFDEMVTTVLEARFEPCVVPEADGYRAFAAYWINHLPGAEPAEGISDAMVKYFGAPVRGEAYDAAKQTVAVQIENALDRARRKSASLDRQSAPVEKIEEMRKKGELVYAYAATLEEGQTEFEAQYDVDGPMLTISLDPDLSPVENAQRYFEKYEKAKRATVEIPKMQEEARLDVEFLEQLKTDLDMAENWPEIEAVRETLQENGYWKGSRTRGPQGGKPGIRRMTVDGFVILIGRNAKQNHKLVTERADPDDLWLHARQIPGSHVLIKFDGRPIPDEVIHTAAELAAYYSSGREDTSVDVDITERRYVRPIKGGPVGLVTYKNESTLTVQPRKAL